MRRHFSQVLVAAAFVLACDRQAVPEGVERSTKAASVITRTPVANVPQEDTSCDLDHTVAHGDADSLIAEFIARDAAGQFLKADTWYDGATECPGHEPGPDSYTVIKA